MKVLVLSDVHGGRWKAVELIEQVEPDVIAIPGDLPSSIDVPVLALSYAKGRRSSYISNAYERFIERLTFRQIRTAKRLLVDLTSLDIPVLLIHGNTETSETRTWMRLFCSRYPNFHWIADRSVKIDGVQFFGHGWVGVEDDYDRARTPGEIPAIESEKILKRQIKKLSYDVDKTVLISHAPPYGTNLDFLPHKGIHAGSKPVRKAMNSRKVDINISGHLHEAYGSYWSKKWWGINAGSVIEDIACTADLETGEITWFRHVVNKIGISSFLYRRRNQAGYD